MSPRERERELMSKIRQCREDAGLSQGDVADRMMVTRPAVSALESGRRSPTLSTLLRYAAACNAELSVMRPVYVPAGLRPV